MARPRRLDDLAAHLTEAVAPRAKSLIITVYGDAVLPHGGSAWLGGLIDLMALFGMSERIVRTSVFRLCKDDWLTNTQIGRRSFYRATDSGKERFAAAGLGLSAVYIVFNETVTNWQSLWFCALIAVLAISLLLRRRLEPAAQS